MGSLASVSSTVSETAGPLATSDLERVAIVAPVATSPDIVPRLLGSAAACIAQHGYSESARYVAMFAQSRTPVAFVGLPIDVAGTVSRVDTTENTGSSTVTVTAGSDGVLAEHYGRVIVDRGGTVGTDMIRLRVSLDGGRTYRTVRVGTASSYSPPDVNVTIGFGAGTLVAGDVIATWAGSSPRASTADIDAARVALAEGPAARTVIVVGDLQSEAEGLAVLASAQAYYDENGRGAEWRASVRDRAPLAALSRTSVRMTGSPTLTFAEVGASGDTITRSSGSWIADGFQVGDLITVAGSASNNVSGKIASLSATVITLGTTDLANEGPVSNCTVIGEPSLTFANSGDTITRNRGSWLEDGFAVGDSVTVDGSASNDATTAVSAVSALVLTIAGGVAADEVAGVTDVTITAGQTLAAWMADVDAEFEAAIGTPTDGAYRFNLSAGRGWDVSPLDGYQVRIPAGITAALRSYRNDIHITAWRPDQGSVGVSLLDASGEAREEFDDFRDGGAGSAAGFTTFRTYPGLAGVYLSQDLTRCAEGYLLSHAHHARVVNLAVNTIDVTTLLFLGRTPNLKDDGTIEDDDRVALENEANAALRLQLLGNAKGQGRRASSAKWTAAVDDVLNVDGATLNGVLSLNLNGTIFHVNTRVSVRSGGL